MPVISLYKPKGLTPLETLETFRDEHPAYADEKMAYAGRLDPLAEGVLVILAGETRFQKDDYLALDKVYTATFLVGVGTDTYDLLGIAGECAPHIPPISRIKTTLNGFEGANVLPYPPFSSYAINGKPLFAWAREGRLDEITLPTREMHVHALRIQETRTRTPQSILEDILPLIDRVSGDFRQEQIKECWQSVLSTAPDDRLFPLITARIHCESGTYIRAIAHELGKRLDCAATLFDLRRDRVGPYRSSETVQV